MLTVTIKKIKKLGKSKSVFGLKVKFTSKIRVFIIHHGLISTRNMSVYVPLKGLFWILSQNKELKGIFLVISHSLVSGVLFLSIGKDSA